MSLFWAPFKFRALVKIIDSPFLFTALPNPILGSHLQLGDFLSRICWLLVSFNDISYIGEELTVKFFHTILDRRPSQQSQRGKYS
jgi:hypothetical protein